MKMLVACSFIFITFVLFGCAPASSTGPTTSEIQLPSKPTNVNAVSARTLLYQSDSRVSYCEILNNDNGSYSGFNDMQLEPLASLSKVITSAWVIEVLGMDYRFKDEWFLKPVAGQPGMFDAYLRTNYDPVINIEKLLYFLSELRSMGVKGIRELTIDETTRIYIGVLTLPHAEVKVNPVASSETADNLKLILNSKNWASRTIKAKEHIMQWAVNNGGKNILVPDSFSVEQIFVKEAKEIDQKNYPIHKTLLSAPLFKYLKNMNVNSNNYMADAFFNLLGGAEPFLNFQKTKLKLNPSDMQIYTGSGLAFKQNDQRYDNVGSCFSYLTVLSYIRQLAAKAQMNLGHIMLNPTTDKDGTFDDKPEYNNAVVLKTGRLFDNPALNLAGFVATEKGMLSFVFLGHDFTATEAKKIDNMRTEMLGQIYNHFSTSSDFKTLNEFEIFF